MANIVYYAVPKAIAEALKLTEIRSKNDAGQYLLSSFDIKPYGAVKAVEEGAEVLTTAQAKEKFNL